ncbi:MULTISPECIES: hypothetical protein [unclassified Brevundimonas]|uniref:hypothetical protein n=1 Tax=unclassified Brevundimonas TaxID=2622653 RepID=UPI000CFE2F48|nr:MULTISPECIES: hypothetical protein [unclassified Brevundimonas]PRA23164.1 hypothetical protein CQ024_15245 [Brevundimonas sp. MYb27]PQZ74002.1 hypothetical protein CQ026_15920 [Brevundimonas sp. MYb31]PRB10662.1 hypothetical protein CQ039_16060 [Brevundimonas sp. MYb52]PRB32350.1 hypothetical protein CQ035_16115 [Brevundimonas sp. MYb46]PRB41167.1 hypothetical protein CQ028_15610 [Brevundimonas sp. MYb33]
MKTLLIAALVAAVSPTLTMAKTQAAPAAPAPVQAAGPGPQGVPAADTPLLGSAKAAPDCGNLHGLNGRAFCVTAPLASVGALAETYIAHFESQGWLAAGGDDNRVVLIKRKDGGVCDGMQMVAFYDTAGPAAPESPGYLGFATIPGNVCAGQPTAGATPQ